MRETFNEQSQRVMQIAGDEARRLKHGYIGTEHILLGMLQHSGPIADSFKRLGLDADRVRNEIEKIAGCGAEDLPAGELRLTPRARQVIDYATIESQLLKQPLVDPKHLLLGLIREPDGVAGQVLRNLGFKLESVRNEVFKIRLMQMKIVERVVRPVRAGTPRKRRMREELLAHLTTIYEQELTSQNDPVAALEEAARRFGDPAELTYEFQKSLPLNERISYRLERWYGWRAPESALHYTFRQGVQLFAVILSICAVVGVMLGARAGLNSGTWAVFPPLIAILLIGPTDFFLIGLLYYKIRDVLFGAFGARKSLARVLFLAMLVAAIVLCSGLAFVAVAELSTARAIEMFSAYCVAGLLIAIGCVAIAHNQGRTEIADTLWALMDIAE